MGLAQFLGLFNSLNIITIGLKVFMPTITLKFLIVFYSVGAILIIFFGIGLDFLMLKLNMQQAEYLISTRDNPVINFPIGEKEVLNYRSTIAALEREITNYNISLSILQALHIKGKAQMLYHNITLAERYKAEMTQMLNKAQKQKART